MPRFEITDVQNNIIPFELKIELNKRITNINVPIKQDVEIVWTYAENAIIKSTAQKK